MEKREQRIRDRAYRLWEQEGRPDGRAEAHWDAASELVAIEDDEATSRRAPDASSDKAAARSARSDRA